MEDQAAHTSDLLQSLPDCAHPEAAPLPPPPAAETGATASRAVEADSGFAVEMQLETSLVQLDNNSALSSPQAGIFFGHRWPALTFGIGFDFERVASSNDTAGASSDTSSTTFLIMPGVRLLLAHSGDRRTELLGRIDAGWGQVSNASSNSTTDMPSPQRIRVDVAPAVQLWVTRSFGVGAAVGIRYDRLSLDTSAGGMSSGVSQSTMGLFSSFHVTGVF
jgi:hypothetical protein